jgi:hypothetical protein
MSDSNLEKDALRFITKFRELSPEHQECVSGLIKYWHSKENSNRNALQRRKRFQLCKTSSDGPKA